MLWHGGGGQILYLGWTDVDIEIDAEFCGTSQSSAVLALVVPDGHDSTHHQLVIGTILEPFGTAMSLFLEVRERTKPRMTSTSVQPVNKCTMTLKLLRRLDQKEELD